jgi:hypothetical protein
MIKTTLRHIKSIAIGFFVCALFALSASAQIGGTGWKPLTVNFKIQSPTNAPQSSRYFFTNNIFHCLTFSNDGAFSIGNTTKPRTEQRFNPDYTNGEIQYQATMMAPSNENSYCVFQIHTGDAQSTAYGSTVFMAFWFTNYGGSIHEYSGTTLATNLGNQWFQLNVDHNLVTQTIRVWINRQLVWTVQDNGAGDFYFKDGVYEQDHGPTLQMDTYITNTIQEWVSSGTNPPAVPIGLTAAPTLTQIPLTWNSSVAATNYNLRRSITSGGPYTVIANLAGTNYTDTTAISGTTYYYVVSALDQFGESSNSTQIAASLFNLGYQLSATPPAASMLIGGSTNFTVTLTTNSGFNGAVNLGVTGFPAGATANFSSPSLNMAGTSTLAIQTAPNSPAGNYALTISGTNGASVYTTTVNLALTTISAAAGTLVWTNGATSLNWSGALNWANVSAGGFGPPGISNSLVFTNWSAVSASAMTSPGSGVAVPANINSSVDGNFSIIGLTNFANAANSSPIYQNLGLASGTTLTAGGVQIGGFGVYDFGANNTVNMSISGAGATLLVTNGGVTISQGSGSGGAHDATLDLSGLDNFVMNGTQIRQGIENITRAGGVFYLAKTNSLVLTTGGYVNTDGSGSPYSGNPALCLGHNKSALGNGAQMYLGLANTISVDYVTIGRGDANDLLEFNPAFLAQNPTATIQGLAGAGSRVGVYVVGDNSPGEAGSTSDTNDFSGGTVNALINYLCVARGREAANDTTTCAASLTFNNGGINANTLAIGFLYPSGSNSVANGTVNVNGGTLIVNSNLLLATVPNVGGSGSAQGTLNINGGTVQATNIIGRGGVSTINLNSGTLNLQSAGSVPGQIANVSTLNIGAVNAANAALLANAASISSPRAIVIAANGTLSGNTFITSPGLVVNGTISPGMNGAGAITNSATTTLGAGGTFVLTVQNANGAPVTGWDFLQTGGLLDIESSNASPFTIQLQSFDPGGSGLVTNFNSGANYAWTIVTAAGGITNFSADKFAVDASMFGNSLAGGTFSVQTNGNSLVLMFTPPAPPVIGGMTLSGSNLAINGSGGIPGGNYCVLTSTNMALPLNQWQSISTNSFDATGNFSFTNNLDPNIGQQFYLLELQ